MTIVTKNLKTEGYFDLKQLNNIDSYLAPASFFKTIQFKIIPLWLMLGVISTLNGVLKAGCTLHTLLVATLVTIYKYTHFNENEISSFQNGLGPFATEVLRTSSPSVTSINGHTSSCSKRHSSH